MPDVRVLLCTSAPFGALDGLALHKLFPVLYQLDHENLLYHDARVLALTHDEGAPAEHLAMLGQHLRLTVPTKEWDDAVRQRFCEHLDYLSMDFPDLQVYAGSREAVDDELPLIAYFVIPASVSGGICENLAAANFVERIRAALGKPVGHDLELSREANEAIARFFPGSRIYRIDHYLGKEMAQNPVALRFTNSLLETRRNRNHISHVEITVARKVNIEGRWGYFGQAGQLRDMMQNHLLQLLCLIAMDPPSDPSAGSIRDEKVRILRVLESIPIEQLAPRVVRGQYTASFSDGKTVSGYLEEECVNRDSDTEAFVTLCMDVRNWRRSGMSFYLRTGKCMPQKLPQIVVHFRELPYYIFAPEQRSLISNQLIIRLRPDEGISLQVITKDQGLGKGMQLRTDPLRLSSSETYHAARIPDAYGHPLLEVTQGNQYLFVYKDEVESAWKWCDQSIAGWERLSEASKPCPAGSWGLVAPVALVARDGRS